MPIEIEFIQDIAIIMIVAGAVMVLFRLWRQPPILGYLIAGIITGPFTLPFTLVKDVATIKLLGELGAVLLLFGIGLEFSWSKLRRMGGTALIIALIEIPALLFTGYQLGHLMGWSPLESLFLGAAISISSSAIIAKTLLDQGKVHLASSRIVMGVLVIEDFAAVTMIAILSGISTTGQLDIEGTAWLLGRLALFAFAFLALGRLLINRIMDFVYPLRSKESLLLVSLGLCFGLALFSWYLGLSAVVGAFLMGTIIGDYRHSEEISELIRPLRDMFSALFFVAMGMLVNVKIAQSFIIPALLLTFLFVLGKLAVNSMATFLTGYVGKTPLRVGASMTQMGEFSLLMGKVARDSGTAGAFILPTIAATTLFTSYIMPQLLKRADSITVGLVKAAPRFLRKYVSMLSDWLEALRYSFRQPSVLAHEMRQNVIIIISNLAIIGLLFQVGAWSSRLIERLSDILLLSPSLLTNLLGFSTLVLCLPSLIILWRSLRKLAHEATKSIFLSSKALKHTRSPFIAVTFRESIMILVLLALAFPATSWVIRYFSLGWYPALLIPFLLIAAVGYLLWDSIARFQRHVEETFSTTLTGEKQPGIREKGIKEGLEEE